MSALSRGVGCPVARVTDAVEDPAISQYQRLCDLGELMPSFQAMQQVWQILGVAQSAAVAGEPAELIARRAAEAVAAADERG